MVTSISTWLRGKSQAVDAGGDELALCRRIAAGETQLFARIVDQYSGLVAAVIAAQGAAASEVEDLTQLTFINAYKGLAGFRGEAKLSSWLYRIAVNVSRQQLKRSASRPAAASVEQAAESGQQPVDSRKPASTSWVANQALAAGMKQIPEVQRIALCLYYFEELSYEEIAATLRLNLNTVRTHIRRGKQRLAEVLDPALLEDA
jgi:RNA polymerase sigma-70 factor (ECF subfamily)